MLPLSRACKGRTGALQVRALQSGGWQANKERFCAYTGAAVALANAQVKPYSVESLKRKCGRCKGKCIWHREQNRPACQFMSLE